jgi:hypothetical protein
MALFEALAPSSKVSQMVTIIALSLLVSSFIQFLHFALSVTRDRNAEAYMVGMNERDEMIKNQHKKILKLEADLAFLRKNSIVS